ncbi:hypothetical protein G7Z17_g2984 [Cylindrodendrum hubeiense]|uniref:AAA+ ATPase domain-containing protein n=1 Tax=Cylindrodendrum hubeiense TaxID=595255 RepID=A0A9P5HGP0_9HYPO|nr:hypothetical protein G7Z17_g2984 [Cylindrodendrum hubeiense]
MESTLGDEPFNWTSSLPSQPANPRTLEGAGTVCETKRFDSFYNASGDRVVLPAGKKYTEKKGEGFESALTVTTYWDRYERVEKTVLEIKSPHMKAALKAVVPQFCSFNVNTRHITIAGEPHCLFHYRQELLSYGSTLQQQGYNSDAAQHVQHLISYMWEAFAVEIVAFATFEWLLDDEPSLDHKYLWMIFRLGDIVYVREAPHQAFLFEEMELQGNSWILSGHCIDYDGNLFGFKPFGTCINSYDGVKPLRELQAIPLNRLPPGEQQTVKEQLVTRGRKFVGIHGQQHLWYNAKTDKFSGGRRKTRIVTDCEGYILWGEGSIYLSEKKKRFKADDAHIKMSEADLMICSTQITFDSHAFDALIIPDEQKQQILSLVRVHEDDSFIFDDLVKGKGRGMIFLLHGEPGVGKTLTADYCRKPLLRFDAGSLGTTASGVEKGLKDAFNLAERWHALLLLDEADVYLEQRKSKNLVHNGIVSGKVLFLLCARIGEEDLAHEKPIMNLVRTACALSLSDDSAGGRIDGRHMELALQPMKQFTQFMEQIFLQEQQVEYHPNNEEEGGSDKEGKNELDGEVEDDEEEEEEEEEEDDEGTELQPNSMQGVMSSAPSLSGP